MLTGYIQVYDKRYYIMQNEVYEHVFKYKYTYSTASILVVQNEVKELNVRDA